jgi:DTW domain-containing protein YfiP
VVPRRSTYRLRRAPREGGLATYEAIACALAALEGAERAAPLFDNFDVMVEQNLKARGMMAYQRGTAGPGPRRAR